MTRRKLHRILLGTLAFLLLVAGAILWFGRDMIIYHIGVVREGVLYRSAQLSPSKLDEVIHRYAIRTVVNLREERNDEEETLAKRRGVTYVWLPSQQVPRAENIQAILDLLDTPDALPLLVHCEHGVGRTGVISGLYRLEYDHWDIDRVLAEARKYAFGGSYWEGQDKTEFLRHYVPRRDRVADENSPGGD